MDFQLFDVTSYSLSSFRLTPYIVMFTITNVVVFVRLQSAKMEATLKQLMEMMKEIKASQESQDSKLEKNESHKFEDSKPVKDKN